MNRNYMSIKNNTYLSLLPRFKHCTEAIALKFSSLTPLSHSDQALVSLPQSSIQSLLLFLLVEELALLQVGG